MAMENGRPTKPSDTKTAKFLRFVDPDDPENLIELGLVDTGNVTTDGKRIMTLMVNSSGSAAPSPPDEVISGSFELPDATANPIGSGALVSGVTIRADDDNGADVWVGGSGVAINDGMRLPAGESIPLDIDDLGEVYVIGTATDKVHYIGG